MNFTAQYRAGLLDTINQIGLAKVDRAIESFPQARHALHPPSQNGNSPASA